MAEEPETYKPLTPDEIERRLLSAAKTQDAAEQQLARLTADAEKLQARQTRAEHGVRMAVHAEKDDDGKPRYKNAEQRSDAQDAILTATTDYQGRAKQLTENNEIIQRVRLARDSAYREYQAMRALIDLRRATRRDD